MGWGDDGWRKWGVDWRRGGRFGTQTSASELIITLKHVTPSSLNFLMTRVTLLFLGVWTELRVCRILWWRSQPRKVWDEKKSCECITRQKKHCRLLVKFPQTPCQLQFRSLLMMTLPDSPTMGLLYCILWSFIFLQDSRFLMFLSSCSLSCCQVIFFGNLC